MRSPALTARGTGLGRRNPVPLLLPSSPLEFPRISLLETVRKVSDAPETKPYGPPKRGFLAHFGLRVPAKSTPGASLAPFSDSFRRGILGNWASASNVFSETGVALSDREGVVEHALTCRLTARGVAHPPGPCQGAAPGPGSSSGTTPSWRIAPRSSRPTRCSTALPSSKR